MKKIYFALTFFTALFIAQISFGQNNIQGSVTDTNGNPLLGANILIKGSTQGTTTDDDGAFRLNSSATYPVEIEVSFIGFETRTYRITSSDAVKIALSPGGQFDEIIVSASRRAEKLQEAPAAVTVLTAAQMNQSGGSVSPLRGLINIPGVELQQQTGQRINIALRGSSGVFATNVFLPNNTSQIF